ncbi:hypothetical protein B0J15DRAFT_549905 [Fusarium solani]|uniref:Leucine-rich repeat domain-containing protein n=1 Tax=Fusarium solani TaxID=169388 RepID=A0A9P9HAW0_FUSSL|nr:uncharacterized protein B0J15DRAFT_549905 [Fusarium solani]KAH7253179.1 hypothetical protein B0J15DRAFT_549905 [Fusarium solani]
MVQTRPQSNNDVAGFCNLPPELLAPIIQTFCFHCRGEPDAPYPEAKYVQEANQWPHTTLDRDDRKTLNSLSLVSKRIRNIAQDIMYHDVRLERIDDDFMLPADRRLPSLLQTVVSRPDLARMVKNLRVHRHYKVEVHVDSIREIYQMAAEALCLTLLDIWERMKDDAGETWSDYMTPFLLGKMDHIHRYQMETLSGFFMAGELVTMLLALLPNLEHANLDIHKPPTPEALRALGVTRLPLRAFTTEGQDRLIKLAKNLDTLTFTKETNLIIPARVKRVWIHHQEGTVRIEHYLRRCKAITSFSWQTSSTRVFCYECGIFDVEVSEIIALLHKTRRTLNSLYLDIRFPYHQYPIKTEKPVGSLKQFTVLEHLLLCTHSVCPTTGPTRDMPSDQALVDILPSSLARLSLVTPRGKIDVKVKSALFELAHYLEHNKVQLPNLKCIRCDSKEIFEGDDGAIASAFRQVDVNIVYKEFPRFDWSYETDPDAGYLPVIRCHTCEEYEAARARRGRH